MSTRAPSSGSGAPTRDLHRELERIWSPPSGMLGFFTAVNHRVIGLRFMVTAFVFFLLAGALAVAMRLQLTLPLLGVLSPDAYNQAFTMHGSTMMFLFVIPFIEGLGIFLAPIMVGSREMAFPRLNAFGYWVYLIAGTSLFIAYAAGHGPDSGWYNYPPLTGSGFRPGPGIDFWVMLITFLEVSALVAAVELIVTILKMRAPGMSLGRMPVFAWAILVTALMIVFAMPALILTSLMLGLDRTIGTHFFNVAAGGDPLLWQHLFWFFGHPDVYIMLLPAVGVASMIIPTLARRPIAAYTLVIAAIVIVGVLSFGVWVHHMYTVGLALVGLNFFGAASMLFVVPSAVHIFAWITTLWTGRVRVFNTALLFTIAFIALFIMGGITGLMIASVPFNWQVHDTQFIVAHFHYTMVGGVVFPLFAAIYHWFPKFTGRFLDERLGRWHFWLFLVGFNVTFLLMHLTGMEGMPRRVYTYLPDLGWAWLNALSTLGAVIMGVGVAVFLWNVLRSRRSGPSATSNPWDGTTLEWATSSPPDAYNFLHVPIVTKRDPLRGTEIDAGHGPRPAWLDTLTERHGGRRETLVTSVVAAEPEGRTILPTPTPWPIWTATALTVAFLGAAWTTYLVPVGLAMTASCLVAWNWPGKDAPAREEDDPDLLPAALNGLSSTIVWGTLLLITIEATLLALFSVSLLYTRLGSEAWPPPGASSSGLAGPALREGLLVASVLPAWLGLKGLARGSKRRFLAGALAGMGLAAAHLVAKAVEYTGLDYRWDAHTFGSFQWTMSSYAALHVMVLLTAALAITAAVLRGRVTAARRAPAQALLLYWAFVAAGSVLFQAVQLLAERW